MKKLVATAPDCVEVVDVEMPEMGEDEVLVRGVRSQLSSGLRVEARPAVRGLPRPMAQPRPGIRYGGRG